ncbi:RNA polymerase-binding protein RbpA [Arthrobacter sp. ISL-30]|uniref:RNA polymerase-binding protein RbpA n=1 Tax=Arthrobacter sp. ISL-30 TaxID=2819109 RepID=UPI001BEC0CE3|nr:RNA polymerase-binding protein RbpA [Arthrobacter sp. ISL-30]MBT2512917.1 RNA polymerase-binding protein RbpA [Arthrobacter sp. ISL-30]
MVHGSSGFRGTRVGVEAGSTPKNQPGSSTGESLPRIRISYWCAKGHETRLVFLKLPEEQIPREWDCPKCGGASCRIQGTAPAARHEDEAFKSHLDYVKERRSSQDAEEVLAGALDRLRARGILADELLGDTGGGVFVDQPEGP